MDIISLMYKLDITRENPIQDLLATIALIWSLRGSKLLAYLLTTHFTLQT